MAPRLLLLPLLACLLAGAAPDRGRGTRPAPPPSQPWGAIYAAVPPSNAHALVTGLGDRMLIHAQAETQCRTGPRGDSCRMLAEFQTGCGALAQGGRDQRLFQFAPNPHLAVGFSAAGTGPTKDAAERDALANCTARDRGSVCRVVASGCAGSR
ncbi:MAG: DUF4189 domain-containing protein [Acetobacteraceae bacterium]|nr:DUF4189 domain-containing protein [Acetobacteraceae bacterium]